MKAVIRDTDYRFDEMYKFVKCNLTVKEPRVRKPEIGEFCDMFLLGFLSQLRCYGKLRFYFNAICIADIPHFINEHVCKRIYSPLSCPVSCNLIIMVSPP